MAVPADHLSQNDKAGLMRGKPKHDEVSIQAIEAMPDVGVPAWATPLLPDVGHNLVLTLSRHIGV